MAADRPRSMGVADALLGWPWTMTVKGGRTFTRRTTCGPIHLKRSTNQLFWRNCSENHLEVLERNSRRLCVLHSGFLSDGSLRMLVTNQHLFDNGCPRCQQPAKHTVNSQLHMLMCIDQPCWVESTSPLVLATGWIWLFTSAVTLCIFIFPIWPSLNGRRRI